ncbi:MAG: hypothetical protein AAB441_00995 [Patescibacteria group bacterium]
MKVILKIIGIIIGVIFGLSVLVIIAALITNKLNKNTAINSDYSDILTPSPIQEDISNAVVYEILQKWNINNGGFGKTILISESYLTDEDTMIRLGLQLKYDMRDDKNAFIMVFTDKKAAELRDKLTDNTMTKDEEQFYDTHYVGQYTKNGNSGLNAFAIYFDGVSGTNSKTIEY